MLYHFFREHILEERFTCFLFVISVVPLANTEFEMINVIELIAASQVPFSLVARVLSSRVAHVEHLVLAFKVAW